MHGSRTADRPGLLCLSGYDARSHRQWQERLREGLGGFQWASLSLPARHFRWRIRGNPLSWLDEPVLRQPWSLLLATGMVDLSVLRGLHPRLAWVPSIAYFHENQFEYPERRQRKGASEPLMVNLYTALAADRVVFNSEWNRQSFLAGVGALMASLPDRKPDALARRLEACSTVLPVPIADTARPAARGWSDPPHLVWNHRWEYDKGPERLLVLLRELRHREQPFRLSVVGQQFRQAPDVFATLAGEFADVLVHWGFIPERREYEALLRDADVVLSTALHDFQGLAVLEAMALGCVPLVPDRLAYPEYVPAEYRYASAPDDPSAEGEAAAARLVSLLAHPRPDPGAFSPDGYRSARLIPRYQALFEAVMNGGRRAGTADFAPG